MGRGREAYQCDDVQKLAAILLGTATPASLRDSLGGRIGGGECREGPPVSDTAFSLSQIASWRVGGRGSKNRLVWPAQHYGPSRGFRGPDFSIRPVR